MGVMDKWMNNVFAFQMESLNKQARVCVNSALNGPELTVNPINSLREFAPIFIILIEGAAISLVIFLLETAYLLKLLMSKIHKL